MLNKVGIILVNYNGYEDTRECIDSINKITYPNYVIVVVDNNSNDNSLKRLKKIESEKCIIVENKKNVGFSGGNNIGIEIARKYDCDYYLLLNNDTLVNCDFIEPLIKTAHENNDNAVVTSKILYSYEKDKIWYAGGTFSKITGRTTHIGINVKDVGQYNNIKKVSFVSGCCMLIPSKIIKKVGFLSEDYFLYCEDLDYCCRVLVKGFDLIYNPTSVIYHKVNGSTSKVTDSCAYYISRNKRYIISRYFKGWRKVFAIIYNLLEEYTKILKGEYSTRAIIKGKKDYKNKRQGEMS